MHTQTSNWLFLIVMRVCCAAGFLGAASAAQAQTEAQAAAGPPLSVAVFLNSDSNRCYDRGYDTAIRRLAGLARDTINESGGINGRMLNLVFYDNKRRSSQTRANVKAALELPELLSLIGISSSTRALTTFLVHGNRIRESGVPFISNISVGSVIKDYPNVYSTRPSQEAERVPFMAAFISEMKFQSVAFLGTKGSTFIKAIGDGLQQSAVSDRIVADHRVALVNQGRGTTLDQGAVDGAIADAKDKGATVLVLAVGTSRAAVILEKLKAADYTPSVLLLGSLSDLPVAISSDYPNAMYQLDWNTVPEVDQDAVRSVVTRSNPEDWVFGGAKISDAPGWTDGSCPEEFEVEPFSRTNLRAISIGARFADMVNLIAESARSAGSNAKLDDLHRTVLQALGQTYSVGKGAFRGRFQNWSFYPDSRVRAASPFILILPQGLGRTQLAPIQFIRTRTGKLRRIDTIYLDIDMVRTRNIDNNQKSFFADFYLAMRGNTNIDMKDLAFTNAFVDPRTNGPHMSIEVVHPGGKSDVYPESMRIYRIAGRFRFQPDFAAYPFDAQRFSIDIQPKSGEKPFVVQPPPYDLRDKSLSVEGWRVSTQYVSYIQDFVPIVDAFTHEPSIAPFYKTRYVWQMKRETTDYYLRVVVPLAFILIVAYLSIFIPQGHLEAIVTIQVTALLSAVALYLSLPQIDSDVATVSDRIFVLDYMMVSLMIVISILRINVRVAQVRWLNSFLTLLHIVIIPIMVIVSVGLILRALPVQTLAELFDPEIVTALTQNIFN
ncbi:MAG: ABC transporter substrate-binding protein [Pseudomonadota bacterium]